MAIQLRYTPGQDPKASGAAFGVGMPISDGGAGAIAQGLRQFGAGAAAVGERLKQKDQALRNTVGSESVASYKAELSAAYSAAEAAEKSGDGDAYDEAVQTIQELNPESSNFNLNQHTPAQSQTIKMQDEDWRPYFELTKNHYTSTYASFEAKHVNTQHQMKVSEQFKTVGEGVQLAATDPSLRTANHFATVHNNSVNFLGGDVVLASTPVVQDAARLQVANNYLDFAQLYKLQAETTTSVVGYNKELDDMIDTIRTDSESLGEYRDDVIKGFESLRLKAGKGEYDLLPQGSKNAANTALTNIGNNSRMSGEDWVSLNNFIGEYADKNFSDSNSTFYDSISTTKGALELLHEPEGRNAFLQWVDENPLASVLESPLFDAVAGFEELNPTHRSLLQKHAESVRVASAKTLLDQDPHLNNEGGQSLVSSMSSNDPAFHVEFDQAQKNLAEVLEAPFDSDIRQSHIPQITQTFSKVYSEDQHNNQFPGRSAIIDSLKNTDGQIKLTPVNLHKAVNTALDVWGKNRLSQSIAAYDQGYGGASEEEQAFILASQMLLWMPENNDTHLFEDAILGASLDNPEAEKPAKFNEFAAFIQAEDTESETGELLEQLELQDPTQASFLRQMIFGNAARILQEETQAGRLDVADVDKITAVNFNNRFDVLESDTAVRIQPKGVRSFEYDTFMPDAFVGGLQAPSKDVYLKAQQMRLGHNALDSGVLMANMEEIYQRSPSLQKKGSLEQVVYDLVRNHEIVHVDKGYVNGIRTYGAKVRLEIPEGDPGFLRTFLGTERTQDVVWMELKEADSAAGWNFPAMQLDVTKGDYLEDQNRILKYTYELLTKHERVIGSVAKAFGEKAVQAAKFGAQVHGR